LDACHHHFLADALQPILQADGLFTSLVVIGCW
jgi:hypothetical protein